MTMIELAAFQFVAENYWLFCVVIALLVLATAYHALQGK